jgi:hypothetical protein
LRKQNQTQRKQGYDGFWQHAFTFCKVQRFTVQLLDIPAHRIDNAENCDSQDWMFANIAK